ILGNPPFKNPSLRNFAPRIGIAWDIAGTGRTAIRTGAGIFHDQINPGSYNFSFLSSPPYYIVGNITGSVPTVAGQKAADDPIFPVAYYVQQAQLASQPNLEGFQYKPEQPTVYKWSFEVQHQLPFDVGFTVGYSGNRAVHLFRVITSMNTATSEI